MEASFKQSLLNVGTFVLVFVLGVGGYHFASRIYYGNQYDAAVLKMLANNVELAQIQQVIGEQQQRKEELLAAQEKLDEEVEGLESAQQDVK